jgi:hypothetical protein
MSAKPRATAKETRRKIRFVLKTAGQSSTTELGGRLAFR